MLSPEGFALTHHGRLKPDGGVVIWVQFAPALSDSKRLCGPTMANRTPLSYGDSVMAIGSPLELQPARASAAVLCSVQWAPPSVDRWWPSLAQMSTMVPEALARAVSA